MNLAEGGGGSDRHTNPLQIRAFECNCSFQENFTRINERHDCLSTESHVTRKQFVYLHSQSTRKHWHKPLLSLYSQTRISRAYPTQIGAVFFGEYSCTVAHNLTENKVPAYTEPNSNTMTKTSYNVYFGAKSSTMHKTVKLVFRIDPLHSYTVSPIQLIRVLYLTQKTFLKKRYTYQHYFFYINDFLSFVTCLTNEISLFLSLSLSQ